MNLKQFVPGLLLAGGITAVAFGLTQIPAVQSLGFSPLVLAILLGMIYGNIFYHKHQGPLESGLKFSQAKLLRLGIAMYGLNISFTAIAELGMAVVWLDIAVIIMVMLVGMFIGRKVLGLDRGMAAMVSIGAAVCGAAAVLAAAPVTKASSQQVAMAVATVVLFGTISMFLYPIIYPLLPLSGDAAYGIFAGSTIHEVAQVVAAGVAVSPEAADTGVVVKLVRVMMLAPLLIIMGIWLRDANEEKQPLYIPWFVIAFIGVTAINTWVDIPVNLHQLLVTADLVFLSMAMAALGIDTNFHKLRDLGAKPLILALSLFVLLIGGGLLLNLWIVPGSAIA
ncbi:MAG: putative sulfate exporter family transporter [Xanthomonadales bacterium]|nr:putative sulfate exporter family transporter [Xanthomonadales bacterium]